jgi:hypothetical protein
MRRLLVEIPHGASTVEIELRIFIDGKQAD